ncbi:hypothetical protein AC249_AIPGENE7239 [Exaiptasia diaphana]|nr:hypothetical protein AC249_AIPGENE7239 [Exaiptasia diaphana]
MDKLRGLPMPSMDWTAGNLPETFRKFKRNCESVFAGPLNDQQEEVKVHYLKIFLGDQGQDIIEGFNFSTDESKKLENYWSKLQSYVKPKSNFRVARAQLRELKQMPDETVDSFMTRARILVDDCEYKDKEEQLIDALIFGVLSNDLRRKLLTKDSTLKLIDAMKIAPQHYSQKSSSTRPKHKQGCLNSHSKETTCPASKDNCNFCGKKGHWEKVCITKQYRQKGTRRPQGTRKKINSLDVDESAEYCTLDDQSITFDTLHYSSLKNEELFATVKIKGEKGQYNLRCKVDTGAPTSVISKRIYCQLYPNEFDENGVLKQDTKIVPAKVKVKSYGGSELRHLGHFTTMISHGHEATQAQFLVTETDETPLLGLSSKGCTADTRISLGFGDIFATVSEFNSFIMVHVRKYFHDRPTKNGIALTTKEWYQLMDKAGEINKQLADFEEVQQVLKQALEEEPKKGRRQLVSEVVAIGNRSIFVFVSEFKNLPRIHIRKFTEDGVPSDKGVALVPLEWENLQKHSDEINELISNKKTELSFEMEKPYSFKIQSHK